MTNELLKTTIELVNDKLHFLAKSGNNVAINVDYTPPLGDSLGYTSLELFLISLSSCIGSSILTLLRKMRKTIKAFEISANGLRRTEHPTGFEKISLKIIIRSNDIENSDVDKVIKLSEDTYCPVWSMIKNNVEVEINYSIVSE